MNSGMTNANCKAAIKGNKGWLFQYTNSVWLLQRTARIVLYNFT